MNRINLTTSNRTEFVEITREVQTFARETGVQSGVITVYVPHTTAGVMINERADPDVMRDLKDVLDQVVPWEAGYRHMEGNTAAHAKAAMMGSSASVIVDRGEVQLGTWQGVFFCEFDGPRTRQVWLQKA